MVNPYIHYGTSRRIKDRRQRTEALYAADRRKTNRRK